MKSTFLIRNSTPAAKWFSFGDAIDYLSLFRHSVPEQRDCTNKLGEVMAPSSLVRQFFSVYGAFMTKARRFDLQNVWQNSSQLIQELVADGGIVVPLRARMPGKASTKTQKIAHMRHC